GRRRGHARGRSVAVPDTSRDAIADLNPEQLAFLLRRLQKAGRKPGGEPARQVIPRRQGEGPWPLSFPQQRFWFIQQLEHRSAAIAIAVDLAGPLKVPCLEAAFAAVARRHEALRTTFDLVDGRPVQIIHPRLAATLPMADLASLPSAVREAELRRLTEVYGERPFDLLQGPLLHGAVVRQEAGRFRLLLVLHHVAADNW